MAIWGNDCAWEFAEFHQLDLTQKLLPWVCCYWQSDSSVSVALISVPGSTNFFISVTSIPHFALASGILDDNCICILPQQFHSMGLEVVMLTLTSLVLIWVQPVGVDSRLWLTCQLICQQLAGDKPSFLIAWPWPLMSTLNGLILQLLWHDNLVSLHDQLSGYPEFLRHSLMIIPVKWAVKLKAGYEPMSSAIPVRAVLTNWHMKATGSWSYC